MKKILILLGVFLFCLTLGAKDASAVQPPSNIVTVAMNGGDYPSISAALADITPSATEPYVIDVMPGTYAEEVTMKSYVHLRGAGREVTTIQGASSNTITLNTLTNVAISGFTIANSNGWDVISSHNCTNVRLTGNKITGGGAAIWEDGTSGYEISGNIITGNDWSGFYFWNLSSDVTITGNTFKDNGGFGVILFAPTNSATITGNTFSGNNGEGIGLYGCSPGTRMIEGNMISGNTNYGIYIDNCPDVTITGNTITGNTGTGISLSSLTGNRVIHNWITGNTFRDIAVPPGSSNISFNVYDTLTNTPAGAYNVKSDGTPW